MGLAPTPDLNHRVVLEIPGPLDAAKFAHFRAQLQEIVSTYGGTVLDEVKTKKKDSPKKK
jgi:anti-anti-sigma regulatory factor